jgi:hypothetical protein
MDHIRHHKLAFPRNRKNPIQDLHHNLVWIKFMVDLKFKKFLVYIKPIEKKIDDVDPYVRGYYIGYHLDPDIQAVTNHIKVAANSYQDFEIVQRFVKTNSK